MSSQPSQPSGIEARALSCTFCKCLVTEQALARQSYPSEARSLPASVPNDGGLTLCPDCATEVVTLPTNWHSRGEPPIRADSSIGDAYLEMASICSFCSASCARAGLGLEIYRCVGDELPAHAADTLCEQC